MTKKTAGLAFTATLLILAPLAGTAAAEAPFSFDRAPGRLPKNVVPIDYDIAVTPEAATKTFTGTESVSLEFRAATDKVVFNTLNLKLQNVRLDGRPVASVATDNGAQLTTVTLAKAAPAGMHRLTLSYTGVIETRPIEDDPGAVTLLNKLSRVSRKRWPATAVPMPGRIPAAAPNA